MSSLWQALGLSQALLGGSGSSVAAVSSWAQNVAQNPPVLFNIFPFHMINGQTAAGRSALGSLQLLEPILAGPYPTLLPSGTDCPGGEILARPQRGHDISDTAHSLLEASSFFVFRT